MKRIVQQKLDQAIQLLNEQSVDCWITFVRETSQTHDPALDLILGFGLTWESALIVTRSGETIAIVGRYDADNVRKLEAYDQVLGYDQSIRELLVGEIARRDPQTIALNYSLSDSGSDGLTHGMFLKLGKLLGDPYASRFVSAEGVVRRLRERKSSAEVERIRATIRLTEAVYAELFRLPLRGMTERQVWERAGEIVARHDAAFGWERVNCPIVNAGPDSSIGHGIPSDITIEPGMIVHFDMGLRFDDYTSDLQRVLYVRRDGETEPPLEAMRAWQACWMALEAGRARRHRDASEADDIGHRDGRDGLRGLRGAIGLLEERCRQQPSPAGRGPGRNRRKTRLNEPQQQLQNRAQNRGRTPGRRRLLQGRPRPLETPPPLLFDGAL